MELSQVPSDVLLKNNSTGKGDQRSDTSPREALSQPTIYSAEAIIWDTAFAVSFAHPPMACTLSGDNKPLCLYCGHPPPPGIPCPYFFLELRVLLKLNHLSLFGVYYFVWFPCSTHMLINLYEFSPVILSADNSFLRLRYQTSRGSFIPIAHKTKALWGHQLFPWRKKLLSASLQSLTNTGNV